MNIWQRQDSNYGYGLMNVASFLTWLIVAAAVLQQAGDAWLLPALLFLVVAVLLGLYPYAEDRPGRVHLYLGLQTVLLLAIFTVVPTAGELPILFFVLSAQAVLFLDGWTGYLWLGIFMVVTFFGHMALRGWSGVAPGELSYLGGFAFFGAFGGLLRQADAARRRSDRLLTDLQTAHEQLRAYAAQAEQLAVAEERNRLARELHDSLGHRLTVAIVQLEGAQRLIPADPERAAGMIGAMRGQLKEAMSELRQSVASLRQSDGAPALPLAEALTGLAHTFQNATGLTVHLDLPATLPDLAEEQRRALFRAAQESLTNVQRHAAAATAWLRLAVDDDAVELSVTDDGQGLAQPLPEGRFGLRGLAERAEKLGGTFSAAAGPAGGTIVVMRLPLVDQGAVNG